MICWRYRFSGGGLSSKSGCRAEGTYFMRTLLVLDHPYQESFTRALPERRRAWLAATQARFAALNPAPRAATAGADTGRFGK